MMRQQFVIQEPLSLRVYSPVRNTGFRYYEVGENHEFIPGKMEYNHLLFLLEGDMEVSCDDFIRKQFHAGNAFLIPVAADTKCVSLSACRIISFSFDFLVFMEDIHYMDLLCKARSSILCDFTPVPVRPPLGKFIQLLISYIVKDIDLPVLHEIKTQELSALLRAFYSVEEMALLFHPLIGPSPDFRFKVLRTYRNVSGVDEFARLLRMAPKTFMRQFKEEFGEPPYQWLLEQKSKHILFKLTETDQSLETIRKDHGFKYPSHFSRFCKEQFGYTPLQLKKQKVGS